MEKLPSPRGIRALFSPVDLTRGSCWKTILRFSLPIILSYLLQQVYTISDAAIVGQTLTAAEVAGVNDTGALTFIFLQFAFGASAGFCVITSCRFGARDERGVRRSLVSQLYLSALLTAVLTVVALFLLDPMLSWIHITPENAAVYTAAHTYCTVIFVGIGAQFFYNFICSFLRSMGDSATPLLFLFFSTVLNIFLDLLFIRAFSLGVFGAAFATVLAQAISAAACFVYAFVKYPALRLQREDFHITPRELWEHSVRGIPLGLQFSVLAIGIIVMQAGVVAFDMTDGVIVSHAAQNGYGAANKIYFLIYTPVNALGTAMTSFTAQNLGAGETERIRRGTLQTLGIMAILSAAAMVLNLLLSRNGAYLYLFLSPDKVTPDTVRFGNAYLYTATATAVLLGFLFVVRSCVQGIEKSLFVFLAGVGELFARIVICLLLPPLVAGGTVSAAAPTIAFVALSAADPFAWLCADVVLCIPFFRNILKKNYAYREVSALR